MTGQHRIVPDDLARGWQRVRAEAIRHVERRPARLLAGERALVEAMAALPAEDRAGRGSPGRPGYQTGAQIGPTVQRLDTTRGVPRGGAYTSRARLVEHL